MGRKPGTASVLGRYSIRRRRCLAGKEPRLLLYGLQHSVGSAAVGGGDQIRERVLRVCAFVSRKHGGGCGWAVARAKGNLRRTVAALLLLGALGLQTRVQPARAVTCSLARSSGWLLWLWLCPRRPREGSADDVGGWAGAPGSSVLPRACLREWAVVLEQQRERSRQMAAPRVDISLDQLPVCAGACTASTCSWTAASISVRLRDFPFSPLIHNSTCRRPLISPS